MNKLKMLLGLLCAGTAVTAQTNFSGTWTQKNQEFIAGPHYANAVPKQITITSKKDSIAVETISLGQGGDDTSHYAMAKNGAPSSDISKKSQRKYTRKSAWSADKKTLTVTTAYNAAGSDTEVETTRIETWDLSADGKQLIIDRKSVETKGEGWEAKGTYEKQ